MEHFDMKFSSVRTFLKHLDERSPGQPEFLQAVTEVIVSGI